MPIDPNMLVAAALGAVVILGFVMAAREFLSPTSAGDPADAERIPGDW